MYNSNAMSELSKAYWQSEGDDVRFSMAIAKVDKERRIVSGFATLDNVDKQGDIVPSEASVKAFERFRGNIREMHQPIAVGKVVSFKSDKFFDRKTGKSYNGVFVSAYVSKGAQDTWEKVLDGTLTGFSIGGSVNDSESVYDGSMDKTVRVIKDYDLHELSLVDNPANGLANFVTIQKFDNVQPDLTKGELENVLWCESDDIIRLTKDEASNCAACENEMKNVGFVESNDVEKADMIKSLISLFKRDNDTVVDSGIAKSIAEENENKELNNMADEILEDTVVEETIEKSEGSEDVAEEATEEVAEAPAETVEETEEAEEAIEKSDEVPAEEAITPAVEESTDADLAKAEEVINTSVASAISELAAVVKAVSEQVSELAKSVETVNNEVASVKDNFDEFGKRVDAVEADTAVRKSGDLGGIVQLQKNNNKKESVWGGRFLKSADL